MAGLVKLDPDLDRIGLFKEMSYIHDCDYQPITESPVFNADASKGKQMMSQCSKSKAGTQDGYFEKKFPLAFKDEGYTDYLEQRRRFRNEEAKKMIGGVFHTTSPTKMANGVGTWYGTFRQYEDRPKEDSFNLVSRDLPKERTPREKPNCKANPGKKGTGFGYPNVTIGKMPEYIVENELPEKKRPQRRSIDLIGPRTKAFGAGRSQFDYFDPNPYREVPVPDDSRSSREGKAQAVQKNVFVPTNPSKKDGGMKAGCLNKFPEYWFMTPEDRYKPTTPPSPELVEKPVFHRGHGAGIYPIRSIMDANVKKEINVTNFKRITGVMYINQKPLPIK